MLKWLTGDKVDHQMADAKQARKIVDGFPANDPWQTLEDTNYWLDSISKTPGFSIERRYENIDLLDMATRKHQEKLLEDYLVLPAADKIQEKRIWKSITDFWKLLGDAYLVCAVQSRESGNVSAAFKANVPLIAARGLRAIRHQMKWVLLRYAPVRPEVWSEIASFVALAEAFDCDANLVDMYPGVAAKTSVRFEFLRVMMLWASSPSGLAPAEQDIAERAIAHVTGKFRYEPKMANGCDYCFDLAAGRPPLRVMRNTPVSDATRYFDASDARQTLQAMSALLTSTGNLPVGVDFGPVVESGACARVLKHLLFNWAKEMPPRASERRRTAMSLNVVHGYMNVLGAVAPELSEGLDFTDTLSHDTWIAEDVSAGGYGVIVPAGKGEWLRVGILVCTRAESEIAWSVGVIRRVKGDDRRQHHVGIQLISKNALLIQLRSMATMQQGGKRQPAILLHPEPSSSGSLHLVTRRELFTMRDPLEAIFGKNDKPVMLDPAEKMESGFDFDWLKFKVRPTNA